MISVSTSQKQVVMNFFENDIKIVKKYFNSIGFDFDEEFRFDVFKEFIYAAAGMFKDLDPALYNQNLINKFKTIRFLSNHYTDFEQRSAYALRVYMKDFLGSQEAYVTEKKALEILKGELQMLIAAEKGLTAKRKSMESQMGTIPKEKEKDFEIDLKKVRREQVDTIHAIGTHRCELEEHQANLRAFEELHKEEFLKHFNEIKEKIAFQFSESLNYFGYDFNETLFRDSERSGPIQRFKKEAGIKGDLNLCKYVEYYLRSVISEALADGKHKERLLIAKKYCEKQTKKSGFSF
jgi:hypothetical protein